jgi:predicted metal-dependent phosphoesterase TrpH
VIDLHLHTTESDGRLTPAALVERAAAARLRVMAVTDHDTTAAVPTVRRHAASAGIEVVTGIEITAIDAGDDVHVLGYFIDDDSPSLQSFLESQRDERVARVEALGERLAALGLPLDLKGLVDDARAHRGRAIGRPQVARAMVAAGYASDTSDAFNRWLGRGRPAFVPRAGAGAEAVIDIIHAAGGLASIAHPGLSVPDERLVELRAQGLDALEAFHPEHDDAAVHHYVARAAALGLLVTGGSDFHGDPAHGRAPGSVRLPDEPWARLLAARDRHVRR